MRFKSKIKNIYFRIKRRIFPRLFTSDDMCKYLQENNIKVGKETKFFDASTTCIDAGRPCLLEIGEYCKITAGVIILTHDYSRSVLRRVYGEILGEAKKTIIGNNVFIGMNSIILMGTQIGNNVIIGAGSVVSGIVRDNVVIAGNPARIVRTLEEHYEVRKKRTLQEGIQYAKTFYEYNKRIPTIKEMDPFFPLFLERNIDVVNENNLTIRLSGDNYEEIVHDFLNTKPLFDGYEEFIKYCGLPI
ncbi:MAG: acyltransferase [Clostridiales bacterium]